MDRPSESVEAWSAPQVSVVLACYNEEPVLEASFAEIVDTLEAHGCSYEIVFVDDGSKDRTPEIIQALVAAHPRVATQFIFHERNQGRGATVTDGFRAARGEVAGYLDVDLEVHARYIPSLVRAIEKGADVATVRRIYAFQLGSLDRYLMSRGYSMLVRRLLGVSLHDTETGYKFFRRERLLSLLDQIEDPGWFWDTEFMVRAVKDGCRIVEIPGAYVRRHDKVSTVHGMRDSLRYFRQLVSFRRSLRARPRPQLAAPRLESTSRLPRE
jgi:glycosyltransferase AglD